MNLALSHKYRRAFRLVLFLLSALAAAGCDSGGIVTPSETLTGLPVMKLSIERGSYEELLRNKTVNFETGARLYVEGKQFDCVIRPVGASSRYNIRWSFKVELTGGETFRGLHEFNLSSQVFDRSMLYTTLASAVFRKLGFPVFHSEHIFLNINNEDEGLFLLTERIEKEFFERRGIPAYEVFVTGSKSRFTFSEPFNVKNHFEKELPDDNNFISIEEFIHALDTANTATLEESLSGMLDIENYLQYHAAISIINNVDGARNNFHLLRRYPGEPFRIVPWDFDRLLIDDITKHWAAGNDIINTLFQSPAVRQRYFEILEEQLSSVFTPEYLFPILEETAARIERAWELDPLLGKDKTEYASQLSAVKRFITERRVWLLDEISDTSRKADATAERQ